MPARIHIENLQLIDTNPPADYQGPAIFGNFNPERTDETYQELFPYQITKEVILKNVRISSGKELRRSENETKFERVKVIGN
jgi:hypothetical protein